MKIMRQSVENHQNLTIEIIRKSLGIQPDSIASSRKPRAAQKANGPAATTACRRGGRSRGMACCKDVPGDALHDARMKHVVYDT